MKTNNSQPAYSTHIVELSRHSDCSAQPVAAEFCSSSTSLLQTASFVLFTALLFIPMMVTGRTFNATSSGGMVTSSPISIALDATQQDQTEIEQWFRRGYEEYNTGNYSEVVKWFRKAAE